MRRPLSLLIAASLLLLLAAPPAAHARPTIRSTLAAINDARAAHGLPPVRHKRRVTRRARSYAQVILRRDRWAHAARPARGSGLRYVGEILGMANAGTASCPAMVAMWLGSPEHRSIVLRARYRYAGVGLARGEFRGRRVWVWVVRLGR